MTARSRADIPRASRVVVKVGSSSISGENRPQIHTLVDALAALYQRGCEVILVSSGAIATGMPFLGLDDRPLDLATQQAAAAVGQSALVYRYGDSLDRYKIIAAQVLLTASDMQEEHTRTNARRALERLLELRMLPIVNENDTVATHEIRFGDNDRLASLVAELVRADALVLLSDVDALYTRPPLEPGAERIAEVETEGDLDGVTIGAEGTGIGTGGATTKVQAAQYATARGVGVLLASTAEAARALAGEPVGTWFAPAAEDH